MRIASLLAALGLTLAACGGGTDEASPSGSAGGEDPAASNQNAPPPEPYVPPLQVPSADAPDVSQTSHEHPLSACGPVDSYRQVSEYRCRDGSQPLGGDPGAGQQARAGNVGPNSTGHIIDLYEVRCPEGTVQIYVDMYGCPEMQRMLVP